MICEPRINSSIDKSEIHSIGITNQRETVVIWDKISGLPLHNAIVWQCRRTTELCQNLKDKGLEDEFHHKTGLYLDPYFSGTKINWLLKKLKPKKYSNLCCGTIDSFLTYKLSNKAIFVTEASNASRTLIFNIKTLNLQTLPL